MIIAIELCKKSASNVIGEKILFNNIDIVLEPFGKRRIDDMVAEFQSQCPNIEELLVAFADQPERLKTDDLIKTIKNRILQSIHPKISGISGDPSEREIAHFLFQIGFLTARKDFNDGSYEHLAFSDNPSLLSSRTNVDQGYSWEIHPVFRQTLKLKNVHTNKRSISESQTR
ncbi:MAG: hypothetical protein HQL77_15945 [Magnetococcales bacterium]|nr:hypothetical protein [Magnetococcales bacterium]